MNRVAVAILGFIAWTIFAGVVGWQIRDGSADTHEAKSESASVRGVLTTTQQARATDHANAQSAAKVEEKRVEDMREHESNFQQVDKEVERYAKDHPARACGDGGDAGRSADFLRVWNAASAGGRIGQDAEPGNPAGAAPGTGTVPGAAHGNG